MLHLPRIESAFVFRPILVSVDLDGAISVMAIERVRRMLGFFFLILLLPSCFGQPTPQSFNEAVSEATKAREAGRIGEAIAHYRRAIEIRNEWEEGWWYIGALQYDADHFADAIPAFQKVVQFDPALASAWNFLGLCEFETGDYANSIDHLGKGQSLGGTDDPVLSRVAAYHLALLLNRRGEFERASALLAASFLNGPTEQTKIALGLALLRVPLLPREIDPSRDALIQAAGETAGLVAQKDPENAFKSFQRLIESYPTIPYAHYAYGIALASANHLQEALVQFREESQISPKSPLPHVEMSRLKLQENKPDEALRDAQIAMKLAPNSASACVALAKAKGVLGDKEQAARDLCRAQNLTPQAPERDIRIIQLYAQPANAIVAEATPIESSKPNSNARQFEELSHRATAFQASGDISGSIRNYEDALRLRLEWNQGRWALGMAYYQERRFTEAIAALKRSVEFNSNDGTAWAVLGLSEFELRDFDNALIHLQRGKELGFGASQEAVQLADYRLAVLLNRKSQYERAAEILGSDADSKSLGKEIRFALGMAVLRIPFAEDIPKSQRELIEHAGEVAALLQQSKYDAALPKLEALIRQDPNVPFLHYAYGTALASLSQYEEAESQFRQELAISPLSGLPYIRLASLALHQRSAPRALPLALRAVQLAPDSAEAHYLLGRTYLELGQGENAVRELEIAKKIAPGSPEVHFNLAKAYAKAGLFRQEKEERAIFVRLNEIAQRQRSQQGDQSYGAARESTTFSVPLDKPMSQASEPR